jgi:ribosome biogenesis GTPase / thiamine phosphate phosphatase
LPLRDDPQLPALGWDRWFQDRLPLYGHDAVPARVVADHGVEYVVRDGVESLHAVAGRRISVRPAVGDWVALSHREPAGVIEAVAERRTAFRRKVAGSETREQVMAANVDVAFVIASAQDVNARRIERYLTMAWQSGASPVVLLTKADLADSADALRAELESVAMGTPVLVTSGVTGEGLQEVAAQLRPARTGVLLGPSGAGKSTLINRLLGEEQLRTREVHRSAGGRHVTTHRELFELPGGGLIIDTPGLREAQLAAGDDGLGAAFEDVETLAQGCRFADCEHRSEPGCAVKKAILEGSLDGARLVSYHKLQRELRSIAARSDARLRADERRKWKHIAVASRTRERLLRE